MNNILIVTCIIISFCFWIYEDEYNEENLYEKLYNYRKTKKTLVDNILSGKLTYEDVKNDTNKLDTSSNKEYLKNHPCVYQFDKSLKLIKKWDNYKDIEKEIPEFKFANISKCLRKQLKTAYDFIWRYEEDVLNNNLN